MAKGQIRSKKTTKKKPLKTMKEKKQARRDKKNKGTDQFINQPLNIEKK
jgi:hypothetical protein